MCIFKNSFQKNNVDEQKCVQIDRNDLEHIALGLIKCLFLPGNLPIKQSRDLFLAGGLEVTELLTKAFNTRPMDF